MTLDQKLHQAQGALESACAALCEHPSNPETWRLVCQARARLLALRSCAGIAYLYVFRCANANYSVVADPTTIEELQALSQSRKPTHATPELALAACETWYVVG